MLTSLAFIFLIGLSMAALCQKIRLPRIVGMLFTGVVMGPYVLNLLDPSILGISSELRKIALVIILIKAGLSLNIEDLKKVGRPAIFMSFLPAVFEIVAFVVFGHCLFEVTRIEAALIGAVLAAVSPAVVVPKMVQLMEDRYGTDKSIPQLILAGASLDDVFVIVVFSSFLGMAQGEAADMASLLDIPVSIVLGIILGVVGGYAISLFFEWRYKKSKHIRNSAKVVIILGIAFLLMSIEVWLEDYIAISGLLAVMSMACMVQKKSSESVGRRLSAKFGKLWIAAEVILFVLVGAAVNIEYMLGAGAKALILIFAALAFRSVGTWISLLGTSLNMKERAFCVIAYLPKATVQAAIGSVPLSLGLACGNIVLSFAVLSILITAPLGAIGMDLTYKTFLNKN